MKKKASNMIYVAIIVIVALILFYSTQTEDAKIVEESAGSGFLEIASFPDDAEIFVDGVLSGATPETLYNIADGRHKIVIRKVGYEDFAKEVIVEAGKKTILEADLVEMDLIVDEDTEVLPGIEENAVAEDEGIVEIGETEENVVNIGGKFLKYYDFSEGYFSDTRSFDADAFSKRFEGYLVFTRFDPANIKSIEKNIDDVEREDCVEIAGQFEYLYSDQSLCVITKEGKIAALGGTWENTENAVLTWKVLD